MFKPIHLVLSGIVLYLVFLSNNILKFLNDYIYSAETLAGKEIIEPLINNFLYIIPVIVIILFLLLLSIMFKKNKPVIFYFIGIFSFIIILVINVYTVNFLNTLIENIVSVKTIKLIHDLVLINMILECVSFILLFSRGIGIDFKKFNFNSDLSKFEISESDKEEFEVNIDIDFNEKKRRRKERLRKLKYLYVENKFLANITIIIVVALIIFISVYFIIKNNKINKEGIYYNTDSFVFKVNNTTMLNTDYQGHKITDNYLIVVNANVKSNRYNNSLYLNDFSLKIEDLKFKPTKKYYDSLLDLGNFYDEQTLSFEYTDYVFVYEIPEKYIESEMFFSYSSEGNVIDILIEPKEIINSEMSESKNMNEKLMFEGPLSGVEFNINNYELNNKFLIQYDYCINENDCISSKEYLRPSINENYDKAILKLNINYKSTSDLDINSFYKLLSKFGFVSYKIGDNWINTYKFEEIKSKRVSLKNDVYIGVNSNIMNAESIKIVFDVRGLRYEYILK
ncbi:MAG: hypothetical protein IKL65_05935 [Bacilli bacterium]|nr:hypothetical protein [Bacilli bacterium]